MAKPAAKQKDKRTKPCRKQLAADLKTWRLDLVKWQATGRPAVELSAAEVAWRISVLGRAIQLLP